MARAPSLSGAGSISPFRGGSVDFGAFNVAGQTASESAAQQAALAFQKIETDWQAGLISNDEYMAAMQQYFGSLDPQTASYYNTASRIANTQYTLDRNELINQIQQGSGSWQDLVEFDRQSMQGLNQNSAEYMDRLNRYYDSQTTAFRYDERDILEQYEKGYLSASQAQAWYTEIAGQYADNPNLRLEIDDKIDQLQDDANAEMDQQWVDNWKAGKISLSQFVEYANSVIASDPGGNRARQWQDNIGTAKQQAQESSLQFRYNLTSEYAQLQQFILNAKPPTGGQSTKTVWTGSGWKNVTSTSAPSPSQQQAWKATQAEVAAAKARMKEIEGTVGSLPGGWVNDDDMIRYLSSLQGKTVRGTPEWIDLEQKITSYEQHKASQQVLAKTGVRVAYPKVGSETAADMSVSAYERAMKTGGTPSVPPTVSGGSRGGAGSAGSAGLPAPSPGKTSRSASGLYVQGTATATGKYTWTLDGQGRRIVVPEVLVKTESKSGVPIIRDPGQYEKLYGGFTAAIQRGDIQYFDPTTGATYLIPQDPKARLALLNDLDRINIDMKTAQLNRVAGTGQQSGAYNAYNRAVQSAISNDFYVMVTDDPGVVLDQKGNIKTLGRYYTPGEYWRGDKKSTAFSVTATETGYKIGGVQAANAPAMLLNIQQKVMQDLEQKVAMRDAAFKRGDLDTAYKLNVEIGQMLVDDPNRNPSLMMRDVMALTDDAMFLYSLANDPSVNLPESVLGTLKEAADWRSSMVEWSNANIDQSDVARALSGPKTILQTDSAGRALLNADGSVRIREGYAGYLQSDGSVTFKEAPRNARGQPISRANEMQVMIVRGNSVIPVIAPYTTDIVGRIMVGGQYFDVTGRIVSARDPVNGKLETWVENPFAPGQMLPMGSGGIVLKGGANVSYFADKEHEGFRFQGKDENGANHEFLLEFDPKSGYYQVLQRNPEDPTEWAPRGYDPGVMAIIQDTAGITLNLGQMDPDQREWAKTFNAGLPSGVWFGTSPQEVVKLTAPLYGPRSTATGGSWMDVDARHQNLVNRRYGLPSTRPQGLDSPLLAAERSEYARWQAEQSTMWSNRIESSDRAAYLTAAGGFAPLPSLTRSPLDSPLLAAERTEIARANAQQASMWAARIESSDRAAYVTATPSGSGITVASPSRGGPPPNQLPAGQTPYVSAAGFVTGSTAISTAPPPNRITGNTQKTTGGVKTSTTQRPPAGGSTSITSSPYVPNKATSTKKGYD